MDKANTEEKNTIFTCEKCDKEFKTLTNLETHQKLHEGTVSSKQTDLERLKDEVLREIQPNKNQAGIRWGSIVVTGVLVILTFVSIGQTVQSASIMSKINDGAINTSNSGNSSNSPLPSSLQNLPDMVGGC